MAKQETGYTMYESGQAGTIRQGLEVHAFRTMADLSHFVRLQGSGGVAHFRYYQVMGDLIKDDGTRDGLVIKVKKYKEVKL